MYRYNLRRGCSLEVILEEEGPECGPYEVVSKRRRYRGAVEGADYSSTSDEDSPPSSHRRARRALSLEALLEARDVQLCHSAWDSSDSDDTDESGESDPRDAQRRISRRRILEEHECDMTTDSDGNDVTLSLQTIKESLNSAGLQDLPKQSQTVNNNNNNNTDTNSRQQEETHEYDNTVKHWKQVYRTPGKPSNKELYETELPKPDTVKTMMQAFQDKINQELGKKGKYESVKSNPSSKIYRPDANDWLNRKGTPTRPMRSQSIGKADIIISKKRFLARPWGSSDDSSSHISDDSDSVSSDISDLSAAESNQIDDLHTVDEDEELELSLLSCVQPIGPEVMPRIRSFGTCITYFGGTVISKQGRPYPFTPSPMALSNPKIIACVPKPSIATDKMKFGSVNSLMSSPEPDGRETPDELLSRSDSFTWKGKTSLVFDFRGKKVTPHVKIEDDPRTPEMII